jgi:phosphoglycolate phosphatase
MKHDIALVIFDLIGTTVEDHGQVSGAFTDALNEYDIQIDQERLQYLRGASKRQAIQMLVPRESGYVEKIDKIYVSFCEHLKGRYSEDVGSVSGTEETFGWLRSQNVKIAINTGLDHRTTNVILAELNWSEGTVDTVVCGDDVLLGRPAPYMIFRCMENTGTFSVHRVVNVGDTMLDIEAAHNAGVRYNVGVLSGAHGREQLEQFKSTVLIDSIASLRAILEVD